MSLLDSALQINRGPQRKTVGTHSPRETLDLAIAYTVGVVTAGQAAEAIGIPKGSIPNWAGQELMRRLRDGMLIKRG